MSKSPISIRLHEPTFGEEEIEAAVEVLRSTYVTSGQQVAQFEQEFGPNTVMVNSGSSANLLAIAALCNPKTPHRLEPGDEVIVSALSWSTTVWPLVQYGLVPKIVDIDPLTLNMDPNEVERAISSETKAIMPVHVYGNPCDMDALVGLCNEHNLLLIEDCCEALGATYNGRHVGTFGDISTFSFYFSHHITTLEGGACSTPSKSLAEMMRVLRAHGWVRDMEDPSVYTSQYPNIDPKFLFVNVGYNLRATELAAAIGLVQLPKLSEFVSARKLAAHHYRKAVSEYDRWLSLQEETEEGASSWFGFPIIVSEDAPFTTAELRGYLERSAIQTRSIICGNLARQPGMAMWNHVCVGGLRHADHVMKNGFSIGCHQGVKAMEVGYFAERLHYFMVSRGCD